MTGEVPLRGRCHGRVARRFANLAPPLPIPRHAALHEGHDIEAVQWTLDGATFAADRMRTGTLIDQMVGCATLAICTSEVWTEARLARLGPVALGQLQLGLERIDRSLPVTIDFATEHLALGRTLRDVPQEGSDWLPKGSLWATVSTRWMLADAFLQANDAAQALAACASLPWPQRRQRLATPIPPAAMANPAIAMLVPNWASAERSRRESVSLLRLLRLSVAMHRGEPAPTLDDPLGDGPLAMVAEADATRLASAGSVERPNLTRLVAR
jgi:hypothetical protein